MDLRNPLLPREQRWRQRTERSSSNMEGQQWACSTVQELCGTTAAVGAQ